MEEKAELGSTSMYATRKAATRNPFGSLASQLLNRRAPAWLEYSYLIGLCAIYVLVMVDTPIQILHLAHHDDGLFIDLGISLSEGRWLGPFSQYTLMKGPGFSAFLALNHWIGIPVSLGLALFHCFAILFFVAICHRFIRSHLLSAVLFALLLWNPASLAGEFRRVVRDQIYYGQTLLVLAFFLWAVFSPSRHQHRLLYAGLAGLSLGWFWLTREEGVWIIPALGIIAAVVAFRIARDHLCHSPLRTERLRGQAAVWLMIICVFGATQVAFRAINWAAYGTFVGVDVKERNFERALQMIDSVRSGGTKPFVAITHAAMNKVEAVSPAFGSLAPYFHGPAKDWEKETCRVYSWVCGEIGAGWFIWALRDAAASAGHYTSPSAASAFFGRLADEISAACQLGKLQCKPQLISSLPPIEWPDVLARMLPRYVLAFKLLLVQQPILLVDVSHDAGDAMARALRFLNYPIHSRPMDFYANSPVGFDVDNGGIYTDGWQVVDYKHSKFETISEEIRRAVVASYNFIFLPILLLGLLAFVAATIMFHRRSIENTCFIVAVVSWILVLTRLTLLTFVDSTSFPALLLQYLAPCYFFLVSGALLSIAALMQLSAVLPRGKTMTDVERFPILIHRTNEKIIASIPQLSLYAKGDNINAALITLEAKRTALAAELEELGDWEALGVAPPLAVSGGAIHLDSRSNLRQFMLKTAIVVVAALAIIVASGTFVASAIQGAVGNFKNIKLGGAPFWMRMEQELDRMASPESDLPEEKKQKLLADIRAIGAKWRPFASEIRSALANADDPAAPPGLSCK